MKYFLALCISLISLSASAQSPYFTGRIVYAYQFLHPETKKDITDQLGPQFGLEQHYFINANNYKSYNEKKEFRQLYNASTNKYYFPNPQTSEMMVMDASFSPSGEPSVIHLDEQEEILGMMCKKLIVKTSSDETTYYYNPDIKVDPETYTNHNFGDWNTYIKASEGALPIKYVLKNDTYIWSVTAISVKRQELSDEEFDVQKIISGGK